MKNSNPHLGFAAGCCADLWRDRGKQGDPLMDHRGEYGVGRFKLQPFRQLLDSGRPVPIKRKALAILSVLAEADGALVTKDELMAAVWPNITVEDNAIQVHVASLRKTLGPDAELLSTVHGYGYRLAPMQAISVTEENSEPADVAVPVRAPRWRGMRPLLAIALVVGVSAGGLWLVANRAPATPTKAPAQIAILPFDLSGSGPETSGFASDLRDNISAALSGARILVESSEESKNLLPSAFRQANRQAGAEFLLGGRIKSDGKVFDVQIQLSDAEEHVVVWSATFQKSTDARAALLTRVAASVANAAQWAVIGRTGKVRLNAASVAAFIEARDSLSGAPRNSSALERADFRKIIAAAPEFSLGHSGLAVVDAFQLRFDPENKALRDELQQEAKRALALDPHDGEAYLALELGSPRFDWKAREALLLKGVTADPGFEPAAMHEGRLLWSVGRNQDALPWFRRAYNIDPLHNDNTFWYAASLASEGHTEESQKLIEQLAAQWPDSIRTRDAHFWTSVISGATGDTLDILADAARWPLGMNQKNADVWRLALTTQTSKDGSARVRALKAIKDTAANGSLGRGEALLLLSMLHDIDGAFAQAQLYEPLDPRWGPFLFLGPTQAMRSDPRFMALAVKLGFAAYWRSTGKWPDYCKAPDLPYDCKAEVEKLAAKDPDLKPMTVLHPIAATN